MERHDLSSKDVLRGESVHECVQEYIVREFGNDVDVLDSHMIDQSEAEDGKINVYESTFELSNGVVISSTGHINTEMNEPNTFLEDLKEKLFGPEDEEYGPVVTKIEVVENTEE